MKPRRGGLYTRMKLPRHRRFTLKHIDDIEHVVDNLITFLENEYEGEFWAVGGFGFERD